MEYESIGLSKEVKEKFNEVFYRDVKAKDGSKKMSGFILALLKCWEENGSFEKYMEDKGGE